MTHGDDVVLAVGAHPDDLECTCAGTLAALVQRGVEVHYAVATDGWCGSYDPSGPEIAAFRLEEARRAAEIVGAASFIHLGMHDQGTETSIDPVKGCDPAWSECEERATRLRGGGCGVRVRLAVVRQEHHR